MGEAVQALAGSLPEARFLPGLRRGNVHGRPGHGPGPRAPARAGRPRRRARLVHPGLGLGPGGPGPGHRRHPPRRGRRPGARPAGPLADRAGRRPAGRLPRPPAGPAGARRGRVRGGGGLGARARSPSAPTWCCRRPRPTSGPGTTTNIEGRVSRLGQKLVPPGQAWPDWMIAAELAVHLGADLGLDSVGDVWDEIERLAPAYRGITRAVLDAPGATDGVVAPLAASRVSSAGGARRPRSTPSPSRGWSRWSARGRRPGPDWPSRPTAGIGSVTGDRTEGTDDAGAARALLGRAGRARRPPRRAGRQLLGAAGGLPGPLRPRGGGQRGAGPGRSGGRRPRCGPIPTTSTTWAWPPADRSGCARPSASMVVPVVPDRSLPRKVVAADFNVPARRGDRRRPHRHRCPGGRGADGDAVSPLAAALHPLLGRRGPALRPRRGLGGVPHRADQGAGGVRRPDGVGHADDLVRAQGHLGHAEPHRAQPGRARSASPRPWPTGSSSSSRRTCSPTRPTGSSSSWPRT